jgi:hypothetical protein
LITLFSFILRVVEAACVVDDDVCVEFILLLLLLLDVYFVVAVVCVLLEFIEFDAVLLSLFVICLFVEIIFCCLFE